MKYQELQNDTNGDIIPDFVQNGVELLRMRYDDISDRLTRSATQFIFRRV